MPLAQDIKTSRVAPLRIALTPTLRAAGEARGRSRRRDAPNHFRLAAKLNDLEIDIQGGIGEVGLCELLRVHGFPGTLPDTLPAVCGQSDGGVDLRLDRIEHTFGIKATRAPVDGHGGNFLLAPANKGLGYRGCDVSLLAWSDFNTFVELAGWQFTPILPRQVFFPKWPGLSKGTGVVLFTDLRAWPELFAWLEWQREHSVAALLGVE